MLNTYGEMNKLDWNKTSGLIPVIVQDVNTLQVLMLGYMNQEALEKTCKTEQLTFYSRTKNRLWTKGETSGNYLTLINLVPDCDGDTLLALVKPNDTVCHLNTPSCFGDEKAPGLGMLALLENRINQRYIERPENSYSTKLFNSGIEIIAQKVGEESVELVIASLTQKMKDIVNESADLIFHLLMLLRVNDLYLLDVISELRRRFSKEP